MRGIFQNMNDLYVQLKNKKGRKTQAMERETISLHVCKKITKA